MLRMYIAQQCFGLSDEGIEDAVYDSQAIWQFVGIGLAHEDAPDATALLKFRRLLERHGLTRSGTDESFNGKLRDEYLSMEWLRSRAEACVMIEAWRCEYNTVRLISSPVYRTPHEYMATLRDHYQPEARFQESMGREVHAGHKAAPESESTP